jgi:hypothetical protein
MVIRWRHEVVVPGLDVPVGLSAAWQFVSWGLREFAPQRRFHHERGALMTETASDVFVDRLMDASGGGADHAEG